MDLWADFLTNMGPVAHKWAHYFPIYQKHFERFRNRPFVFIEIGCGDGGSLPMWRRFFGPYAQIVGIDIRPECKAYEAHHIHVRIGSQDDTSFLGSVVEEFGMPGIVLDDGSHMQAHINATFEYLYPRLDPDGVYAVEDLHCAYWPDYGGGLRDPGTFIERAKGLVDQINGYWTADRSELTDFTRSTISMSFYDSVVVFEKGRLPRPAALISAGGNVAKGFSPPE